MVEGRQLRRALPSVWLSTLMHSEFWPKSISQAEIEVVLLSWGHNNCSSVLKSSWNLPDILLETGGYPKIWPQKSSWGFPVCFWPRVGLGRWRMRSFKVLKWLHHCDVYSKTEVSVVTHSFSMLEFCLSWEETSLSTLDIHLWLQRFCFSSKGHALKSENILTLREISNQTQSNQLGLSKKIVSAFIMLGTLIILYSVQYRLNHLHRNSRKIFWKEGIM